MDLDFINKADSIYLFCFTYKNYINNITGYILSIDATCSGIQQIAGIMGDIELGEKVNINESDDLKEPNDIYTSIIDPFKKNIINYVNNNKELNLEKLLEIKIDRNLIKRPVITFPYSVSIMGIKNQLVSI